MLFRSVMDWRKERYKDAGDFTFVFVGNIEPEKSKELIARYLGALPSINRKESYVPINLDLRPGINKNHFDKQMENPKAIIVNNYSSQLDPNMLNRQKVDMLKQIMTIVYQEKIREDEGGTYGVSVSAGISDYPKGQTILQISFETEPAKKDYLNEIVHKELSNLAKEGPRMEDFQKVKEFMSKRQQEQEEQNGYWRSAITDYYSIGYDTYNNYVSTLNTITPENIREIAKIILDSNNLTEVIMTGVK